MNHEDLRHIISMGKTGVFDAERFIHVIMRAFDTFISATKNGGGEKI